MNQNEAVELARDVMGAERKVAIEKKYANKDQFVVVVTIKGYFYLETLADLFNLDRPVMVHPLKDRETAFAIG